MTYAAEPTDFLAVAQPSSRHSRARGNPGF